MNVRKQIHKKKKKKNEIKCSVTLGCYTLNAHMILCTFFYVIRKLATPLRIDEYFNRESAIMDIK
jgi:heterodisulfide reductase subunit B